MTKQDKALSKQKQQLAKVVFKVIEQVFEKQDNPLKGEQVEAHERKKRQAQDYEGNSILADNTIAGALKMAAELIVVDSAERTMREMGDKKGLDFLLKGEWMPK